MPTPLTSSGGPQKQEKSREKDGRVTTETTKHEHHEEIDDEEVPDDGQHSDTSSIHEVTKETKKNYTHVKDEDEVRDSFCASKKSYNFLNFSNLFDAIPTPSIER